MVACGYLNGMMYSTVFTLFAPILSDVFGFTVENVSHFFTGISCAFLATSFIQVGTTFAKVENRVMLGVSLLCALIGSVLITDWQAIGRDPCSAAFNSSITDSMLNDSYSGSYVGDFLINETSDTEVTNTSSSYLEACIAQSSSSDRCFWNPQSRVTGDFCNSCAPACLSEQKSLDIVQFSIGALLIASSASLGFVFISAVTSEITSVESQGLSLSCVIGSNALGRAVSPTWFVKSYERMNKHTFVPMPITAAFSFLLLLLLVVLYKQLAPKSSQSTITSHNINTESTENGGIKHTQESSLKYSVWHKIYSCTNYVYRRFFSNYTCKCFETKNG
jgi:hypothetical protein